MSRVIAKIGERVELDPRRAFTPKQRLIVYTRQNGLCAQCPAMLGKRWECDHIIPWNQGGRTEVDNAEALCEGCHAPKTKADISIAAKTKRLAGETGNGRKRAIPSRGFPKMRRPFPKRIKPLRPA